jgi:hypothetical protein
MGSINGSHCPIAIKSKEKTREREKGLPFSFSPVVS